jgi:deoxyribodipyrimidine photo-lyase
MTDGGSSIWWVRKDLRLTNNPTLELASRGQREVIPLFILDPVFIRATQSRRVEFLFSGLIELDKQLRRLNSKLFVQLGKPEQVLKQVSSQFEASVYAEEDYTPDAKQLAEKIIQEVPLILSRGLTIFHPDEVRTDSGLPYKVFSQYKKRWLSLHVPRQVEYDVESINFAPPQRLESTSIPKPSSSVNSGEIAGIKKADAFTAEDGDIFDYSVNRSRMDRELTSGLSPFLNLGMVSVDVLMQKAFGLVTKPSLSSTQRSAVETWISELIWREFFQAAIYHFPHTETKSFRPAFDHIAWNLDDNDLLAWKNGATGYPIVDACMRQLAAKGTMHNRGRMIVASFLVKDLLIDWREGASWFMQNLTDGDIAANIGGWQWTAGTGLDAAPYFRVFNPILQGQKFDPHGEFVRSWIPELRHIEDKYVHKPWESPLIGKNATSINGYPLPMVDHFVARTATLSAFESAKNLFGDTP